MKSGFTSLRKRFSDRLDSEHEQALVRLAIVIVVFFYFLLLAIYGNAAEEANNERFVWVMVGVIAASLAVIIHIAVFPRISPKRRIASILLDIGAITYFFFNADEQALPLYFLYLWVIFGYGFRYGSHYLFCALAAALVGFGIAVISLPYWSNNRYLGGGLWIGMFFVSLYVNTLLGRLTKALKAAEAANQVKRYFISSVSHELRTPLNAIIGMVDLLHSTPLNNEQTEMVRNMDNASHLMLSLIEDVLDFSKIEAGKIVIEQIAFDLRQLATSTIDIFKLQAAERGLGLSCHVSEDVPPMLEGDPHHLRQVLVNLLSNAVKFTEKGEISLKITSLLQFESRSMIRFEVQDTGIGIPPAAQQKIFESFTQAADSTTRRYGGTGLGTTISKQLVELMGGHLALNSEFGAGSTFWFDLELKKPPFAAHEDNLVALPAQPASRSVHASGYRILIAEDDATNRMVIEKILNREGHVCTLVQNGEEALDRLEEEEFDAVILDMNMPVMSGIEAAKIYSFMKPKKERAPMIMFSANVTQEVKDECLAAGVDEFLPKPIQVAQFLSTLDKLAGNRTPARHIPKSQKKAHSTPILVQRKLDDTVLNYSVLAELEKLGQDTQFMNTLIAGFVEDNTAIMHQLEQDLPTLGLQSFQETLHALKGSAVSIGAVALASACKKYEKLTPAELRNEGHIAVAAIKTAFDHICKALADYQRERNHSAPVNH